MKLQRQIDAARPAPLEIVKTICGCTHDLAFHNRDTDVCYAEGGDGKKCTCQRYVGPEPLGKIVAMPLTDLEGGVA